MPLPSEFKDQVRQASDIVDVIGSYVSLKRSGAKFKALSPFNKEKTPSFFVDPAKQIFKCFSSGKGGDVFEFLMQYENLSFPEAVRLLAQRAGLELPESTASSTAEAQAARNVKEELISLYAAVAKWWHELLLRDAAAEPARHYLRSRDFKIELASEFGLGYAPSGWDATLKWALSRGTNLNTLLTAKLVAISEQGKHYDFFRGRLMIPICDDQGRVVAFSGRLLDPEAKAQKYVNSPETPIFNKSRILFGLNKTKRAIIEKESALICEGQIDLMRCWSMGIKNVVAPQGTAFSDYQAQTLKRLANKEVVICFDADRAGQNAAERTVAILLPTGLNVRVMRMPSGEDPDSFLRHRPAEEFTRLVENAPHHTRYQLERACEGHDVHTPVGRGEIARLMIPIILQVENAVQREAFLLEVASRVQVSRQVLQEELEKEAAARRKKNASPPHHGREPMEAGSEAQFAERRGEAPDLQSEPLPPLRPDPIVSALISLLLSQAELVPEVARQLELGWIEGVEGASVLQQLLETHAADSWEGTPRFLGELDDRCRDYVAGLAMNPTSLPQVEGLTISDYVPWLLRRIQGQWAKRQVEILENKIKSGQFETTTSLKPIFEHLLELKRLIC